MWYSSKYFFAGVPITRMGEYKYAQISNFLQQKGYSQQTIQYITNLPKPIQKQVGALINQKPNITEQELLPQIQQMAVQPQQMNPRQNNPAQQNNEKNTPQETQLANRFAQHPDFQKWCLINLYKMRMDGMKGFDATVMQHGPYYKSHPQASLEVLNDFIQPFNEIYDWYVQGIVGCREALKGVQEPLDISEIKMRFGVQNPNVVLASTPFQTAYELSDEWHAVMAGKGEGLEYRETREDIVYGPEWKGDKDPTVNYEEGQQIMPFGEKPKGKWYGWTIKKVTTPNNLEAEGNKVGHCVGGFAQKVKNEECRIFSLRDPTNTPHVTMEVDPNSWTFWQIKGNGPKTGNKEPGPALKKMLGEWFKTLPGVMVGDEGFDYSDVSRSVPGDIDDALQSAIYKGSEDYGLPANLSTWKYDDAYDSVKDNLQYSHGVHSSVHSVGNTLAAAAFMADDARVKAGVFDQKLIRQKALKLLWSARKHGYVDPKHLTPEQFAPYKAEALEILTRQNPPIRESGWNTPTVRFNDLPDGKPEKDQHVVKKAVEIMKDARMYDSETVRSLKDVPPKVAKEYISMAIDSFSQIAQAYSTAQKNNENWDYDYQDPEPQEEEFEDPDDYTNAVAEWEKNQVENEKGYREQAMPYALDDAVIDSMQDIMTRDSLEIPNWIIRMFGPNSGNRPYIVWVQQQAKKKAAEEAKLRQKGQPKRRRAGWFGTAKFGATNDLV